MRILRLENLGLGASEKVFLPRELGWLASLRDITLNGNYIQAPLNEFLPVELLTQIESLNLRSNQLSGPIPSQLGLLSKLTYLDLGNNNLASPFPEHVFPLMELQYLGLELCSVSLLPSELGLMNSMVKTTFTSTCKVQEAQFN